MQRTQRRVSKNPRAKLKDRPGREKDRPEQEHDTVATGGCVLHPMEAFGLRRRGDPKTMIYDPTKPLEAGNRVVIYYGNSKIRPRRGVFLHRKKDEVLLNSQGKLTWFKLGKADLIARLVGVYEPISDLEKSDAAPTPSTSVKSKKAARSPRTRRAAS